MSAIRTYLLRLITGAFLVSTVLTVLHDGRIKRTVRICCGCFLAVLALQPLLDLVQIPWEPTIPDVFSSETFDRQTAEEKNRELLSELIREQTEAWVQARADGYGMEITVTAEVSYDAELQSPVPTKVRLCGRWTPAQQAALRDLLRDELGIPYDRQEWSPS